MDDAELAGRARRTMEQIANASLATVSLDGRPWNSPLYVAFDSTLTFYWSSQVNAAHSANIAVNQNVALVIFDSTAADDSGHAVYVSGTARELGDQAAVEVGLRCLAKRKNERTKPTIQFLPPHPRRVYALAPETIWTNVLLEQDGYYFDERVVVKLV
jgi:hypothetical protein